MSSEAFKLKESCDDVCKRIPIMKEILGSEKSCGEIISEMKKCCNHKDCNAHTEHPFVTLSTGTFLCV